MPNSNEKQYQNNNPENASNPNGQQPYTQGAYYNPNGYRQPQQPMPPYYPNPNAVPNYYMPYQAPPAPLTADQQIKRNKRIQKKSLLKTGLILGGTILAYIMGQLIVGSIINILGLTDLYETSAVFSLGFNAIGISLISMTIPFFIMSKIIKNNYITPLVPQKKNSTSTNLAWICFGLGYCFIAQIITAFVISFAKNLGYELQQPKTADPDSLFACIMSIVCIAIVPGILEEFSLRCCALGALKKYGKGFAVFITSVVFGLMHMNVIQFVFAFLAGLVLGYITIKTDNIIPAIIVHATNNSASSISDFIQYYGGEKLADSAERIIFAIWLVLGIIGTIALIVKKEVRFRKAPATNMSEEDYIKEKSDNSFFVKCMCMVPGLFLPFVIMILCTNMYIKH